MPHSKRDFKGLSSVENLTAAQSVQRINRNELTKNKKRTKKRTKSNFGNSLKAGALPYEAGRRSRLAVPVDLWLPG